MESHSILILKSDDSSPFHLFAFAFKFVCQSAQGQSTDNVLMALDFKYYSTIIFPEDMVLLSVEVIL